MMTLRHLDLFTGIMGFSLGLERTKKYETVGTCEIEPYCQALIKEKKPNTPCWPDIVKLNDYLERALTLSRGASPVRILAQRERVLGYSMTEPPEKPQPVQDSSGNWCEPFAWYDRESHCWKTWQRCLVEEWEPFAATWPKSGMTRNGIAYRLPMLVHRTCGKESGLFATPTTMDSLPAKSEKALLREATVTRKGRGRPANLRDQICNIKRWSTISTSDSKGASRERFLGSEKSHGNLREVLRDGVEDGQYIHPKFAEWMMGYPMRWTELKDSETQLYPKSLKSWAAKLQKG